jgi:3'(2'), 5'-bisphosphate nucleotidase
VKLIDLANQVAEIARAAGTDILDIYSEGATAVTMKVDDSPLTQADLQAHRRIVAGLGALSPRLPVLSEESAQVPFEERQHWERYWLVDPLDGTKEFLSRNGEFTVNIALIIGHAPALGVVYAPVRHTLYTGVVGAGAWKAVGSGPAQAIRVHPQAATPVRVVGSKSHRGASLDGYLERLGPHELVAIGSSLKLCLVAEGAADLYPRLGPTSEWDTAAGQAVVVAAGGFVVTRDGKPLEYNRKADLLNPEFLVYADPSKGWLGFLGGTPAGVGRAAL